MESLESCDVSLMQSIFNAKRHTVREAYYLDTGKIQIRYIISKRRLMYLHHILTRDNSELIHRVYQIQQTIKTRFDWHGMIQNEKLRYSIDLSDAEISMMSKNQFKKYVDLKVNKFAFECLVRSDKSKVQNIIQCTKQAKDGKSKPQEYLRSTVLSTLEKQTIFDLRSRNFTCKSNMKTMYLDDMSCRVCKDANSIEDENHTFQQCKILIDDTSSAIDFRDVYGTLSQQVTFIKKAMPIIRKRNILMKIMNNDSSNLT